MQIKSTSTETLGMAVIVIGLATFFAKREAEMAQLEYKVAAFAQALGTTPNEIDKMFTRHK